MNETSLSLLLKPSSHSCNLECVYCFYKRVKEVYNAPSPRMSRETASDVIRKACASGASRLSFCWQGGEPTLMGLDFYKHVLSEQKRHASAFQIIENSLQTNGILLDDEWCEFLAVNGFLVGISLDGPSEMHDRYRCFAGGRGSFDRVMESIDRMKRHGVDFNVLVLLNDINIGEPERLYRFLRENNFNYLQFIPCYEPDSGTGRLTPFSVTGEQLGAFYSRLYDLWMEDGFPYVSIRLFEDIMIYWLDGAHLSCGWMERCGTYLLVEHNGDCYPCDFYVYPEWRLGNLADSPLEEIWANPLREKFSAMKAVINPACRDCPWVNFCNGDCTKFRGGRGGNEASLSEYCAAWKMLFEHIGPGKESLLSRARGLRAAMERMPLDQYPRNENCPCGSGRKFKKCCGRGL